MIRRDYRDGEYCPLVRGRCLERQCRFWFNVRGTHPQTGQEIDRWDCKFNWDTLLLIELSKHERQTGAAVESFRNEMVKGQQNAIKVLAALHEPQTITGEVDAMRRIPQTS